MNEFIVDTNVPLTAQGNGRMSEECADHCAKFIERLLNGKKNCKLVIDANWDILREYEKNISVNGPPTFGKKFLKWVYNNQSNPDKIKKVTIHSINGNYLEVPQRIIDIGFDPSDRKFIAVAIANNYQAPIVQASDSKWIGWKNILKTEGMDILFLCYEELQDIFRRKMKQ